MGSDPTLLYPLFIKPIIAVVGGVGTIVPTLNGRIFRFSIIPPSDSAQYDIELVDSDGFGVWGRTGNQGRSTFFINEDILGATEINIANASQDGSYQTKIWYTSFTGIGGSY